MKTKTLNILLLFVFIFNAYKVKSQSTFKRYINEEWMTNSTSLQIFEMGNSILLFTPYENMKLDSIGALNNFKYIKADHFPVGEAKEFVFPLNDSMIVFSSSDRYSMLAISRVNIKNFNFQLKNKFINLEQKLATIKSGKDGKILISGRVMDSIYTPAHPERRPLITIIDSNLNKFYDFRFKNRQGTARFCFETSDNHFITGMTVDTVGACIAKTNTMGNVLWAKSYFRPQGMIHTALENTDGTYTVWGSLDSGNAPYLHATNQYLMNIDSTGNVLWCKKFGDSLITFEGLFGTGNLTHTNDGGYAIASTVNYYDQYGLQRKLVIIKTDSNGDTLWTRCHGASTVSSFGTSIQQTTDGGYLVAGASNSKQWFDGGMYILKTDSFGMTASHCQEFNYPIPFSNMVVNDSNIFLAVDTGLVQQAPSLMYDSAAAIPPNIDGCWLSGVGITEHEVKLNQIYSAIPNPSNGLFTLKTNMENNDPITVLIYDILGHQILPAKDFSGEEPTINLTSQPAGIYFVKIICQNKVQVVKVMKE